MFSPEGVQPTSGILVNVVRQIFSLFSAWYLAVHDNILIGADSEEDLLAKWNIILDRCIQLHIKLLQSKPKVGLYEMEWFS